MTASTPFHRFAFAYGITFAVLYVVALAGDFGLITVYPTMGIVLLGTQHAQDLAPAMGGVPAISWFGWMGTAALGALVLGLLAALWPDSWAPRIWPGWLWLVPLAAMCACVYLTMPWFRL
jgi:hypothetical protein